MQSAPRIEETGERGRELLGTFAERFVLETTLGRGGFGTVFRAFDRKRRRRVALKVAHRRDARAVVSLKDEFRIVQAIDHPNLVSLDELFVDERVAFFTMELVHGVDLRRHIARRGVAALDELAVDLARGLAHLHGHGVVHGDVKASNVLVDLRGQPIWLDFGLARSPDHHVSAPEDVAALGVLLEELATFDPDGGARGENRTKLDEWSRRMRDPVATARPTALELVQAWSHGTEAPRETRAFVGRAVPLAALSDALDRATRGTPTVVFVSGRGGIGKSALVARFLAEHDDEVMVLSGRCSEREVVPFQTLDAVVDATARALAQHDLELELVAELRWAAGLFPAFREVLPPGDAAPARPHADRRHEVGEALGAMWAALGRVRPLVLAIDDLQWGDEDGARLLFDAMASLGDARVLLLAIHRPLDTSSLRIVRGLDDRLEIDVRELEVPPLDEDESRALLDTLGADRAFAAATEGSPFLIETWSDGAQSDDHGPSDTLAERIVRRRLSELPADARRWLETLATAGHALSLDLLSDVLDESIDVGALRSAGLARWVRTSPSPHGAIELDVYHDRLRELIAHDVPAEVARGIHESIARALMRRADTEPMWICVHLSAAGRLEEAADYAAAGADHAAKMWAFARAAELYAFVLSHHRALGPRRDRIERARAEALMHAGRGYDAALAYLALAERTSDGDVALDLRRMAAEQLLRAGFFRDGVRELHEVLSRHGVTIRRTPWEAIRSLIGHRRWLRRHGLTPRDTPGPIDEAEVRRIDAINSGAVGLSVVDSIRSADLMSEALRRSLAAGERGRLAAALSWWTAFLSNEGGPSERQTRTALAEARALTEAHGHAYARGCLEAASALTEFHLGHFDRALAHCDRGTAIFERETQGTTKEASTLHIFGNAALALDGRLVELHRRTDRLVRTSEARGERYALTNYRQGLMILRWLALGRPDRARRDLDLALEDFGIDGFVVQHWMDLWGRIAVSQYEGRPREAWERCVTTRPRVLGSLLVRTQFTRTHSLVLEASCAIAMLEHETMEFDRMTLDAWARAAIWAVRREGRPWTAALATMLEGCRRAARGELRLAHALLRDAAERLAAHGHGLYAALIHVRLARSESMEEASDAHSHTSQAQSWVKRERLIDPLALSRALIPGFARADEVSRSR